MFTSRRILTLTVLALVVVAAFVPADCGSAETDPAAHTGRG